MLKADTRCLAKLETIIIIMVLALASLGVGYVWSVSSRGERRSLVVSTTTSLFDTGLLDTLEDLFEGRYNIDLYFISVGTGLAIQHAKRGDADLILVHAPSNEFEFMESGYGVARKIVAYNFFAIVGPLDDPAEIKDLEPIEALAKIKDSGEKGEAVWISRGDNSGTHTKERLLWSAAGFDSKKLRDEAWYIESGTGMGKTLQIANEKRAYTLADMGTYLKYFKEGLIDLQVLVSQGEELLNVYSVIAVNPDKHTEVNFEDAITFIKFLVSDEAQSVISEYGKKDYGRPLFYPAVKLLKEKSDPQLVKWIEDSAYFDGSECPQQYRRGLDELYP